MLQVLGFWWMLAVMLLSVAGVALSIAAASPWPIVIALVAGLALTICVVKVREWRANRRDAMILK